MNRKISLACITILFAVCLLNILCNTHLVYAKSETEEETNTYSDIDTYLQTCVKNAHIPSLSVTIVDKNNVLFSENYGDCENSDTPFFLGSVSKSFTAVCIMQLVEQGKIDLSANISTYLPDVTDGEKITVSQLLNHTSGLGEYQTIEDYKIINEQGIHIKNRHKYPLSENSWITVPAGYISASTNDLGKYLQMYLNGGNGIVSKQSIDTMFYGNTVYVDGDIPFWYGYGWATVIEPLSEPVLRHSGLVETGTSCIFILPEKDIAIAIASNVNDYFVTNNMMDSLGWGIVLMLLDNSPNEIIGNAYLISHVRIDLIMMAVLATAILSLCLLPKYIQRIKQGKKFMVTLFPILLDWLLTVFILLLVPAFFETPLWVAKSFVPDVFITVVILSTLFFVNSLIKGSILCRYIIRKAK